MKGIVSISIHGPNVRIPFPRKEMSWPTTPHKEGKTPGKTFFYSLLLEKIIFSNSSVENLFFLTEICEKKYRLRDFFVECCAQTTEIAVFEYSAIMDSSTRGEV